MNAQYTTRGVLGQFIHGAPQTGDVEFPLMEADHQKVGLLPAQEVYDRLNRWSFDKVTLESDAITGE